MSGRDNNLVVWRLAAANVRSKLAESLYLWTGLDFTHPVQVYAIITSRCNACCRMCTYWRDEPDAELPAATWIAALRSLRRGGSFHVQFCAAEPLLRGAELFEILTAAGEMGITAGITTNGLLLTEDNARQLIASRAFNVNISIDSLDPTVHEGLRRVPGMLERVKANVERLMAIKAETGSNLRVVIRPLICSENVHNVHEVVQYAADIGATGVNFQPIVEWGPETSDLLNVPPADLEKLVGRLVEMKRQGLPIMNSPAAMAEWPAHFARQNQPRSCPCCVPLRNLSIYPNGDVLLCQSHPRPIGNIATDDLGKLWRSPKAREERKKIVKCPKNCTGTSTVSKTWRDYIELFRRFTR